MGGIFSRIYAMDSGRKECDESHVQQEKEIVEEMCVCQRKVDLKSELLSVPSNLSDGQGLDATGEVQDLLDC